MYLDTQYDSTQHDSTQHDSTQHDSTQHESTLHLQVVADLICPWCFIGKRSLDQALEILAGRGVDVDVEWLPYQLNPTMPAEGMDRKEFRTMRFGWDNALAMDARAVEAGRRLGAEFNYRLQTRTPNTVAAHALARLARAEGGAALQERVVDALFAAISRMARTSATPSYFSSSPTKRGWRRLPGNGRCRVTLRSARSTPRFDRLA